MLRTLLQRTAPFWCTLLLAIGLGSGIVACGATNAANMKSQLFTALEHYKQVCPADLETPACAFVAGKLRDAVVKLDNARHNPSDESLIDAAAAVDDAIHAIDSLLPATVKP